MKLITLLLLLSFPALAADPLPASFYELTTPSYPERSAAHESLENWAHDHLDLARVQLVYHALRHPDPEIRTRLRHILRNTFNLGQRPYLGIRFTCLDLTHPACPNGRAIRIEHVAPNSSAHLSGLRPMDFITRFGNYVVGPEAQAGDFVQAVSRLRVGEKLLVTVIRADRPLKIRVTLKPNPREKELSPEEALARFEQWLSDQQADLPEPYGPPAP